MKVNQKVLKSVPFILLAIYYVTFLFPTITHENRMIMLIVMVILAAITFGVIIKNEPSSKVIKQKIVQLSFGIFITVMIMTYFLNVP